MENVNVTIGRFQPFTLGHLKCCENVYKDTGLPTVLLVIEPKKTDKSHPFDKRLMEKFLSKITAAYDYIAGFLFVASADIVKNAPLCRQAGFEPVTWSCGTDRIESYRKMTGPKYAEMAELVADFRMIEIRRTDSDISATKVRKAIADGDADRFERMVPEPIHGMFYKFRKALEQAK